MLKLKTLIAGLLGLATAACATTPMETASSAGPAPALAGTQFRRGVNVLGYDPIWNDPAKGRFQEKHFAEIRRGGFDFVRVNLFAFRHMDANHRLPQPWLDRLDWIVREAGEAGLGVILDQHDFDYCGKDADACEPRLKAFWTQIAPRYRDAPGSVAFELLNEPYGELDADRWNRLSGELLAIVRETNPTRTVVIGPTRWNNMEELPNLKLPADDRNILVTFHSYEPFRFTHQGTTWTDLTELRGVTFGESDKADIRAGFDRVADWARANGRPILLGEFGAYDKSGTPLDQRIDYTSTVAREAERHGFGWSYWQFDSNFLAWDMERDGWVEPIHKALIPEAN